VNGTAMAKRQMSEIGGGDQTFTGEIGAQKGKRVALQGQGQAQARIILDDMLAHGISGSNAIACASLSCAAPSGHCEVEVVQTESLMQIA
jgi:hypothetical protein